DDPMVVWAALAAPDVRWVGAGQVWHDDAVGCPACGGRVEFGAGGGWACDRCDFARPVRDAWLKGADLVMADGTRQVLSLGLPGQFNRANAAMAALAATEMPASETPGGAPRSTPLLPGLLARLASVDQVADGFDTSWLWDVPFERLAGRSVVATGDRRLDLAVRLRYAEVTHAVVDGP